MNPLQCTQVHGQLAVTVSPVELGRIFFFLLYVKIFTASCSVIFVKI